MEVALQMVGHYQHRNVTIKGVNFVNGQTVVRGADELVGNICRYLEGFGAFPPHEAEKRQAVLDRAAGKIGDMRGAKARLERARKELEQADRDLEEARAEAERRMLEREEENVTVENKPAPKGRGRKSSSRDADPEPQPPAEDKEG
jgi:hypothetical protein